MLDRRTIHVEDILAAEAEFPDTASGQRQTGAHDPDHAGDAAAARGHAARRHLRRSGARGPSVLRQADRAARRPSPTRRSSRSRTCGCSRSSEKNRNRELTRRYESLEQQTATSEDPAGDRQLADRSPAGVRRHRSRAPPAVRGDTRLRLPVRGGPAPHVAAALRGVAGRSMTHWRDSQLSARTAVGRRERIARSDPDGPCRRCPGRGPGVRDHRGPAISGLPHAAWPCRCCAKAPDSASITIVADPRSSPSRTSRSRSWRPSPTRRSSPSRTSACSRNSKPGRRT